jgi:hypothetical protein
MIQFQFSNPGNRLMNLPKSKSKSVFLPTLSAGRSHLYEHTLDGDYMGRGEREGVIFHQVIIKSLKAGIWILEWSVLKHFAPSFRLTNHTGMEPEDFIKYG